MRACLLASLAALMLLWAGSPLYAAEAGPAYTSFGPFEVLGNAPHIIEGGVGIFNLSDKVHKRSDAGRIEFRFGRKVAFVGPAFGAVANNDGGRYGYAGIYADIAWGRITLTPVLAIGAYRRGNSIDLGGTLEFRESLELAYRLFDRWRTGISFAHISNAGIYDTNPGQQDIFLTLAFGF